MDDLQAPFPWFGGKRRVAPLVWSRLGAVANFTEPFFGSGAVLLGRPDWREGMTETVNDKDGFVANFWRAIRRDPDQTARWADEPVFENDLHAKHYWLTQRREDLRARLEGDPDYYDAKIAGWWVWGICCWIGSEFCAGKGPWTVLDGKLVKDGTEGAGINRKRPHLTRPGVGVHQKFERNQDRGEWIRDWFQALSHRLRDVRVCSGDWSRILGPVLTKIGLTGVFLDPPYTSKHRDGNLYLEEDTDIGHAVAAWAVDHGDDPLLRICLCGYEGEYEMPDTWETVAWSAGNSYGSASGSPENRHRERLWFSPGCLRPEAAQLSFFS